MRASPPVGEREPRDLHRTARRDTDPLSSILSLLSSTLFSPATPIDPFVPQAYHRDMTIRATIAEVEGDSRL